MRPLKVADLFCGMGGLSKAARSATRKLGREIDLVAVNHWPLAIQNHRANDPDAIHFCEDLNVVPPRKCVPGNHLDLLIAAPSCVHHSNARGDRPRNEEDRASAWCIVRWLTELSVDRLLIENVPEFRTWGPLDKHGKPIKAEKGKYFLAFVKLIEDLGFRVEYRILNCADYGDPTKRRRFFLQAVREGMEMRWPTPKCVSPEKLAVGMLEGTSSARPWKTARNDVIDWTRTGKSIFRRKKPLARKTLERIYSGLEQFGGPNAGPYLQALRWYIQQQYPTRETVTLQVEATVAQPEPVLFSYHGGKTQWDRSQSIDEPLGTQDTSNRYGLAEPCLIVLRRNGEGADLSEPVPALCAGGNHLALAEPSIIEFYGNSDAVSVDEPLPAVTTKDRHALVTVPTPFILPHEIHGLVTADSIDQPLRTITATNGRGNKLVEPCIIPNFGERDGQAPRAHSVDDPLPAVTSHGAGMLAEPTMICVSHGDGNEDAVKSAKRRALSVDEPMPTITGANRGEIALAQPIIIGGGGPEGSAKPQSIDSPLKAIVGENHKMLAQPVLFEGDNDTAPFILVQPDGTCVGIDIHLRMLHYTELQRAHSLPPEEYHLTGTVEEKVKLIGNSVPKETGEALCMAALWDERDETLAVAA